MKAMVLREFNEPLLEEQRQLPLIGENDLLIRVLACGVCYTDVKISTGLVKLVTPPLIMGHEVAGEVVDLGRGVHNFSEGDRVCVYFYLNCGVCENCLGKRENLCLNLSGRIGFQYDGGYAEYIRVPATHAYSAPAGIPIEEAAILVDAVAAPLHGLKARANLQPGETVAVVGIGGLGIHAIQIAKILGGRVLAIDLDEQRLQAAREFGAEALNGSQKDLAKIIVSMTEGKGVDVVLDLVGRNDTLHSSLSFLKLGGRYVIVGYNFEAPFSFYPHLIMTNEFTVIGSRASSPGDLIEVIRLVEQKKLKTVVSERFPLSQANLALERLKKNQIFGRAVLVPLR